MVAKQPHKSHPVQRTEAVTNVDEDDEVKDDSFQNQADNESNESAAEPEA